VPVQACCCWRRRPALRAARCCSTLVDSARASTAPASACAAALSTHPPSMRHQLFPCCCAAGLDCATCMAGTCWSTDGRSQSMTCVTGNIAARYSKPYMNRSCPSVGFLLHSPRLNNLLCHHPTNDTMKESMCQHSTQSWLVQAGDDVARCASQLCDHPTEGAAEPHQECGSPDAIGVRRELALAL
jgi:hypothetical protein